MDELYRDYILEHYKEPAELRRARPEHDLEFHDNNPLCGDEMGVHIRVEDGKIADLAFHGQGCAISQAAASIASDELIGMPVDEAAKLDADWMLEHMGIEISATRRKCALLNLKVMRGAITGDPKAGPAREAGSCSVQARRDPLANRVQRRQCVGA